MNKAVLMILLCSLSIDGFGTMATLTFSVTPMEARITINGQYYGTGKATIHLEQAGRVSLHVECEGYKTLNRNYQYNFKYGYNSGSATYNKGNNYFPIELEKDVSYLKEELAASASDSVNTFILLKVKPGTAPEAAWKSIINVAEDYFEDTNFSKMEYGTLKTQWIPNKTGGKKIRTRLIVRIDSEDPLVFKMKLQSEFSSDPGAFEYDDEKFQAWNSVMNKYKGLIGNMVGRF